MKVISVFWSHSFLKRLQRSSYIGVNNFCWQNTVKCAFQENNYMDICDKNNPILCLLYLECSIFCNFKEISKLVIDTVPRLIQFLFLSCWAPIYGLFSFFVLFELKCLKWHNAPLRINGLWKFKIKNNCVFCNSCA